jgi:hypothetical protein
LLSVALAAPAFSQVIGIYADPGARECAANVGPLPFTTLHVIATLEGEVPAMTGAQFRITGIPASWTPENAFWEAAPGITITIGHPLFPAPQHPEVAGVNVAIASCTPEAGTLVPLGLIRLFGAPTPENVVLRVEGFELVSIDPPCPFVTVCDSPFYSKACVAGGEATLNGNGNGCDVTAVQDKSWSQVKSLYEGSSRD